MEWRVIPVGVYDGVMGRGQYAGDFVDVFFCVLYGGPSAGEGNNWVGLVVTRPGRSISLCIYPPMNARIWKAYNLAS